MPQLRPWSSYFSLMAYGLMTILCFSSIAAATDETITDASPELFFVDTSPAFTWKIFADSDSFDIADVTTATIPIRIRSAAPDFSLSVLASGKVGMGIESPQTDLHVSSVFPFTSIRLEAAGFSIPYKWDLAGSDEGFALIDAIADEIPWSVQPGAPSNSLVVNSAGNVGFGLANPTAPIHVSKLAQAGTAEFLARFGISDDAVGSLAILNASAGDGLFIPKITARSTSQNAAVINEAIITNDVGASAAIVYNAAKGAGGPLVTRPLVTYRNNNIAKVTIAANGAISATSFNPVSSRALKHDIQDLDSEKAADALRQLTPVQFVYNDDESAEQRVGFIAEDVPEIVANKDRQSVPIMDVVALVTRVVKDHDRLHEQQQKTIDQQQKTIDGLMKRLEALESQASAGR